VALFASLCGASSCGDDRPEPRPGDDAAGLDDDAAARWLRERLNRLREPIQSFIWGGTEERELVEVVAIGRLRTDGSLATECTGIALTEDRVLTAGHCFSSCIDTRFWVTDALDAGLPIEGKRLWKIRRITRHHGFGKPRPLDNDLALVELDLSTPAGRLKAWPISNTKAIQTQVAARKVGYGWTGIGHTSGPRGKRLRGDGTVKTTADPGALSFRFERGLAVCKFDSGGASFELDASGQPAFLVGITSAMDKASFYAPGVECSANGIDVSVDHHRAWIEKAMKGECTCTHC
jgi:hypothetical protein